MLSPQTTIALAIFICIAVFTAYKVTFINRRKTRDDLEARVKWLGTDLPIIHWVINILIPLVIFGLLGWRASVLGGWVMKMVIAAALSLVILLTSGMFQAFLTIALLQKAAVRTDPEDVDPEDRAACVRLMMRSGSSLYRVALDKEDRRAIRRWIGRKQRGEWLGEAVDSSDG